MCGEKKLTEINSTIVENVDNPIQLFNKLITANQDKVIEINPIENLDDGYVVQIFDFI